MRQPVQDDAIVKPVVSKNSPQVGDMVIMVSSQLDLKALQQRLGLENARHHSVMLSRLYTGVPEKPWSVIGPIVSAPYAVMALECLIAWGARQVVYLGWCGGVSPEVRIGDIVLASGAFVDEGTSRQYDPEANPGHLALPSPALTDTLAGLFRHHQLPFHQGLIWTTDGIFRETPEKVMAFQQKQALAVEMELSALFTVGQFRNVDVAGIVVVSDEVSRYQWQKGFNDEAFINSRAQVTQMLGDFCLEIEPPKNTNTTVGTDIQPEWERTHE